MLRRTNAVLTTYKRSWSPFTLFMVKMKAHPALTQAKSIPARGKLLGHMYRKLTPADLKALQAEAASKPKYTVVVGPRTGAKVTRASHAPTAYNKFVARFLKGHTGSGKAGMKAAAKAWKAQAKL